ncbi:MAG: DegT/DnrJ/EryC1/StrS family aminotransferase [Lentisphaeria bacterium]|nr:DegT/DnrJ/EryC1/StrS family aminotransferase [Lentisphaeria bacterium]MDY0176099.1 DegT/DnrJ/EryC1/StrS family aminotransferase [Lentisphaeria bacterium]NLZ59164.1 DegT/DnrJ/EryC1/StrS family aminotransferase [Lentisphaerota bacterium]
MSIDKKHFTGGESEGGITSSYATDDGVKLKVPYAFMGSIYDEQERQAVLAAMEQDSLTMGPKTQEFQNKFAAYHQVKHAFACSNCTTGMHVCTQLFDIMPGDEVIVTPNTFVATSLVVLKEGGVPVYADIDPRTYNIDPADVARKITSKTKAIYVVHYGGLMVDMDPIMELAEKHGLKVLEDCAHAIGAKYKGRYAGGIGHVGVFSFHSLKNISTCGEGGMITTNCDEYAKGIQNLRCMNNTQPWDQSVNQWKFGDHIVCKKESELDYWMPAHFDVIPWNGRHWGSNYRMNEIQAAVGCCQMDKLGMLTAKRQEIGRKINAGLAGVEGIETVWEPEGYEHVYHLYTLCVNEKKLGASRDDFMRVLYQEEGVQGILHYQPTFHFTGLQRLGYDQNQCPNASEFFYKRELNLPMHPRLSEQEIADMIAGIKNTVAKLRKRNCKA